MTDIDDRFEASLWDPFWLPPSVTVVDHPWIRYTVCAADQPALNQGLRFRIAPELAAALDRMSRAHAAVTSRCLLAPRSQDSQIDVLLRARGWEPEHEHFLRTRATDASIARAPNIEVRAVDDRSTLLDCIRVCADAFGHDPTPPSEDRIATELSTARAGRVHRFVAYDPRTGEALASAGLNVFPSLGIGFLWGGGTASHARGRGAYRSLVAARLDRARDLGCALVGVYARTTTSEPIVDALGFARHGSFWTYVRLPTRANHAE